MRCTECARTRSPLSPFDTKRWIADDGIQTLAYGHFRLGQLRSRWHNQQLFTNEAALGPVRQIIDNRRIWLGPLFNNLVDFQRPDRVCCSFSSALKLARLVQISHVDERRKLFFCQSNRSIILCWQ